MRAVIDSIARHSALALALLIALPFVALGLWLGAVPFIARGGHPWVNILPVTFTTWETRPFSDHFLLSFIDAERSSIGRAYPNYTQPWLIVQYVLLQPLRLAGVSYATAQIGLVVPHVAAILALVAAHCGDLGRLPPMWPPAPRQLRLVVVGLALAALLSLPSLWVPFFRFNPEQYCFVPALAFCHLAAADFARPVGTRTDWLALLAIALFAPIYAPFAIVSWWVLWQLDGERDNPTAAGAAAARLGAILTVAATTFLLPRLIIFLTALSADGSSAFFRTGLDGSERYFSSMLQAVLEPFDAAGRAWLLLQWPVAALAATGAAAALSTPQLGRRMLRQLFIAWLPYLWTAAIFPQWVSVHPYCFDLQLALGAAFCLTFWLQRRELEGWVTHPAARLAVLIGIVALLMTNLIDLARFGR